MTPPFPREWALRLLVKRGRKAFRVVEAAEGVTSATESVTFRRR